ncbi:IclR family transcriptional regulator, partial [Fodinicola feengrottensis]
MRNTPDVGEQSQLVDDFGTASAALEGASTASVLKKTQLILSAFDGRKPRLGLTALARRSGLPKPTTYRLAQELSELGFLDRVENEYQLGWRIFELGQLAPAPARLRRIARPVMVDLHAATKAALHLMVPRGLEVMCVESLAGRSETAGQAMAGTRAPIWFTASGKLFLAYDTHCERALRQLDQSTTEPLTRHSARNAGQLRSQITAIRAHRWSQEREERVEGRKSLAVPITLWDSERVVAALSITTEVTRRDEPNTKK